MRILVFQHLAVEHPGTFGAFWAAEGHDRHIVELDAGDLIPTLDPFDLLVVMGGPMDVWQEREHPWLVKEKSAIRHWVADLGRPYLGVCLGHQLLADALGGHVAPMARPEVGMADVSITTAGRDDKLFAGFGARLATFQWHGAEIVRPPEGSEILAANAACPVQAIRWGGHAYGIQFHIEITDTTVDDWQNIPEYRASLETALGAKAAAQLGDRIAPQLPTLRDAASRMHRGLTQIVQSSSYSAGQENAGPASSAD